jgi:enoyl-CoA hydratase/carnithine racemase
MGGTDLEYEVSDRVATIWLNRPGKYNCINWDMLMGMAEYTKKAGADDDVQVIVVRGRNGTFCSGFDLSMVEGDFLSRSRAPLEMVTQVAKVYDGFNSVGKPTLALVDGYCTAGGFELMISCDFAIATEDARIGDFHIRRGMTGGGAPFYRLPRIIGMRKAKELMFTGKLLSGKEAHRWGLINDSCPEGGLDAAATEFLEPMLNMSPYITWITKMAANRGLDGDSETLMVMEHLAAALTMQSDDAGEAVRAFLEKRDPKWLNS